MLVQDKKKKMKRLSVWGWLIGLVIASSSSFITLEYASVGVDWIKLAHAQNETIYEADIFDVQIESIPAPPEPTTPQVNPEPDPLNVKPVKDLNESEEKTDKKLLKKPVIKGPKRPKMVFKDPSDEVLDPGGLSKPAVFPGGNKELYDYLAKHLKFPAMAKEMGIQGRVYVSFVINKNGSITDIKIKRGLGAGLDEEVIRVVANMPHWIPGELKGKKVRSRFVLPVVFNLR